MYMKTIILALTFAAFVAAAPIEEDIIIHPSMIGLDDIDITPEEYKAELSQMLLEMLPEGLSPSDIQGMSIEDIHSVEESNIQNEISEYEAELQQILGLSLEDNSLDEDESADFDLQDMIQNSLIENSLVQDDVSALNV